MGCGGSTSVDWRLPRELSALAEEYRGAVLGFVESPYDDGVRRRFYEVWLRLDEVGRCAVLRFVVRCVPWSGIKTALGRMGSRQFRGWLRRCGISEGERVSPEVVEDKIRLKQRLSAYSTLLMQDPLTTLNKPNNAVLRPTIKPSEEPRRVYSNEALRIIERYSGLPIGEEDVEEARALCRAAFDATGTRHILSVAMGYGIDPCDYRAPTVGEKVGMLLTDGSVEPGRIVFATSNAWGVSLFRLFVGGDLTVIPSNLTIEFSMGVPYVLDGVMDKVHVLRFIDARIHGTEFLRCLAKIIDGDGTYRLRNRGSVDLDIEITMKSRPYGEYLHRIILRKVGIEPSIRTGKRGVTFIEFTRANIIKHILENTLQHISHPIKHIRAATYLKYLNGELTGKEATELLEATLNYRRKGSYKAIDTLLSSGIQKYAVKLVDWMVNYGGRNCEGWRHIHTKCLQHPYCLNTMNKHYNEIQRHRCLNPTHKP